MPTDPRKGSRKIIFRSIAVAGAALFLIGTLVFFVSLVVPVPRPPIPLDTAYQSYHYYQRPEHTKKIALTFDDGPDPQSTATIVETLKRHNVSATFFMIGQHVLTYPELAQLVADQGFEIGNHTFTHSLGVHQSLKRLSVELATTERLIELTTGQRTQYYRPPYLLAIGIDPAPNPWVSSVAANQWSLALGYVPVGIDIDSHDWDAETAEEVFINFTEHVEEGRHIALFHDVPHTAEALDGILLWLKAEGYEVVPLGTLLAPTAPSALPFQRASLRSTIETSYLLSVSFFWRGIGVLGALVLGLLLVRIAVLAFLLAKKHRQPGPPPLTNYPLMSVLIPAYNEEDNIEATVRSVLQSSYPRREVIVVNDGSTDKTGAIVHQLQKQYPKIVRVIDLPNGGKAHALTLGAQQANGDVLVVLDADAVLDPWALHAFAPHFANPTIGAVAGKVYTTSTKGLLNKFQALEYCVGQNIEKKAFSALGLVGVVPGPAGAWRKSAVLDAGGFPTDTLVEDQDMTLTLLQRGWRIQYEPAAITYTETPATLSAFLAQRFRWVYGGIECFWKHVGVMWARPTSGMSLLLMPNIFIFGIILPLTFPLIDLVLVGSILFGWWQEALVPVLLFTIIDMVYVAWGLRGERPLYHIIWVVPLSRIVYRQLLYYTVARGLVRSIEGRGSAWNKVARLGETRRFFEEKLAIPR